MRVRDQSMVCNLPLTGLVLAALFALALGCSGDDRACGAPSHECSWDDTFDQAQCPSMTGFEQCVVFVDQGVECSGDGSSWVRAKRTVQEGVDTAACGVLTAGMCATWQVWVRAGTHRIHQGCVEDTLRLRSNVELYGGFAGDETELGQRDPVQDPTVLEGRAEGTAERVNNVIVAQAVQDAVVDGLAVRGGGAYIDAYVCGDGQTPVKGGGGVALIDGSLTVRGCDFSDNGGIRGGAISSWFSELEVRDSAFEDNEGAARGGAVFAHDSTSTVDASVFVGNRAGAEGGQGAGGGALRVDYGDAEITGCDFTDNQATEGAEEPGESLVYGGAVSGRNAALQIDDCTFTGNSADGAGGAVGWRYGPLSLANSQFTGNLTTADGSTGGSLHVWSSDSVVVTGCSFTGNQASVDGGAIQVANSESVAVSGTDCFFGDNQAKEHDGGAIQIASCESVSVADCTFENNTAFSSGGALYLVDDVSVAVTDCVLAGNTSGGEGGGVSFLQNTEVALVDCEFGGNSSGWGGGLHVGDIESLELTGCLFESNEADELGGGAIAYGNVEVSFLDCAFVGNTGDRGGGLELEANESVEVTDCDFEGNTVGGAGGGAASFDNIETSFRGCAFHGNWAYLGGGGLAVYHGGESAGGANLVEHCTLVDNGSIDGGEDVFNLDESGNSELEISLDVTSSILWSAVDPVVFEPVENEPSITFSDVRGGFIGEGNIDADPLFVDEAGGDLHLSAGSPCIGTGEDGSDMGAFPYE